MIGEGKFGKVYKACYRSVYDRMCAGYEPKTSEYLACKVIPRPQTQDKYQQQALDQEIGVL